MNYLNANKVIINLSESEVETFEVGVRGVKEIRYINQGPVPHVMVIEETHTLLYFHPHIFSIIISDELEQQGDKRIRRSVNLLV